MELKITGTIELPQDELAYDALLRAALNETRTSKDLGTVLASYVPPISETAWPVKLAILAGETNDISPKAAYRQFERLGVKNCLVTDMLRVTAMRLAPRGRRTVFLHYPFRREHHTKPGRFRSYVMLFDEVETKARLLRDDNPPMAPEMFRGKSLVSYIARVA